MENSNEIKYAMYLRKSTDTEDRQIQSIEDQQRELSKLKQRLNINIIAIYKENQSAKQPGRTEFTKMLHDIRQEKIQGIVCWKINRLSRNPVDGGEIQWLLQQKNIQSILTPEREYLPGDNVLMMSVELGMANQFIIDLSNDVKRGLRSKAEKGWRPGLAPIGYTNDKFQDKGNKRILVDEERFPLIRKMWDMLLSGEYTVSQIHKIVNDKWNLQLYRRRGKQKVKTSTNLNINTVYRIFTNSFYCGKYEYGGITYEGKHKPMITLKEYDYAQKILGRRGSPRPKYKELPFSGILRCGECGYSITVDEKNKYVKASNKIKSYLYYKCTKRNPHVKCSQKPTSYPKLEKQIVSQLNAITIPKSFLKYALEILNTKNDDEILNRKLMIKNQQKAFNVNCEKIDNLLKLYISPENTDKELLTGDEFKEQKSILIEEKKKIQEKLNVLNNNAEEWIDLTEKTFEFATYASTWFQKGDYQTKSKILRALGSNFILEDGKLSIELMTSYKILQKGIKDIKSKNPTIELANFGYNKAKTAYSEAVFNIVSG